MCNLLGVRGLKLVTLSLLLGTVTSTSYGYDHIIAAKHDVVQAEQAESYGNLGAATADIQKAEYNIQTRSDFNLGGNAVAAEQALQGWYPGNGALPAAAQDLNQAIAIQRGNNQINYNQGSGYYNNSAPPCPNNSGAGYDHILAAEQAARQAAYQMRQGNVGAAQNDVSRANEDLATRSDYNLGGYANAAQNALSNWSPGDGGIGAAIGDIQNALQYRATH